MNDFEKWMRESTKGDVTVSAKEVALRHSHGTGGGMLIKYDQKVGNLDEEWYNVTVSTDDSDLSDFTVDANGYLIFTELGHGAIGDVNLTFDTEYTMNTLLDTLNTTPSMTPEQDEMDYQNFLKLLSGGHLDHFASLDSDAKEADGDGYADYGCGHYGFTRADGRTGEIDGTFRPMNKDEFVDHMEAAAKLTESDYMEDFAEETGFEGAEALLSVPFWQLDDNYSIADNGLVYHGYELDSDEQHYFETYLKPLVDRSLEIFDAIEGKDNATVVILSDEDLEHIAKSIEEKQSEDHFDNVMAAFV